MYYGISDQQRRLLGRTFPEDDVVYVVAELFGARFSGSQREISETFRFRG